VNVADELQQAAEDVLVSSDEFQKVVSEFPVKIGQSKFCRSNSTFLQIFPLVHRKEKGQYSAGRRSWRWAKKG
jgi:hypothetical protein